jgi:hypothetical protein
VPSLAIAVSQIPDLRDAQNLVSMIVWISQWYSLRNPHDHAGLSCGWQKSQLLAAHIEASLPRRLITARTLWPDRQFADNSKKPKAGSDNSKKCVGARSPAMIVTDYPHLWAG